MTPRLDMVAVDLAAASEDVIEAFRQSEHSRLPVYDGTPDNIAGVVFAKDLVPFAMGLGETDAAAAARWQDLVRPAAFVPETKTLDSQLRDFQRGPAHLAIVVDEFGGTSGLITLEDILEEIVGEIHDEHDVGEAPSIRQDGDRYWVDGRVTLDDLSQALGRSFEHPEVSTVGGLVYSVLGRRDPRAPRPDDADRARCLYHRARHPAAPERRVPRPAGGGPAVGGADRGARSPAAREARPRVRALRALARPLDAHHARGRAHQRRHRGTRVRGRDGGRVGRAGLRGPAGAGADDAPHVDRGHSRGPARGGGGPPGPATGLQPLSGVPGVARRGDLRDPCR